LLDCGCEEIGNALSADLTQYSYGNSHDELKWIDVQQHAANILNKYRKVVFVTAEEIERGTDLVDEARQGGSEIVVIPTNLRDKISEQNINENFENKVRIFTEFVSERNENFEFKFISTEELSLSEKMILNKKEVIFSLIGGKPFNVKEVLISETMQKDDYTFQPTEGLWIHSNGFGSIIIKRSVLNDQQRFIAVLLHELAHAISGATDATRRFESELTRMLGIFGNRALNSSSSELNSEAFTSPTKNSLVEEIVLPTGRVRVDSSNLYSIGYNRETSKLQIEFKDGKVYEYDDVPENVYDSFRRAESKGQFARLYIYSCYKFKMVS
jgi:hypothetical protein